MLVENINDEQLLKLCLDYQEFMNYPLDGLSGELIILYSMKQLGEGSSYDDVIAFADKLCVENTLANMVECGELQAEFTEDGIIYSEPEGQNEA